jgi:hypothetical protein
VETPSRGFQFFRRDFLFGAVGGFAAGKAAEWAQPLEWTVKGMPKGTRLSFAQAGEDLVIDGLLDMLRVARPTYLDVGAYEPIESNNTYLLYRKGGRGVLVEPNVALTPRLKGKRPGDTVLTAGIGLDDVPEADYYVLSQPQLNTFDKDQADRVVREGLARLDRVVKMPLLNINRVIAEHLGGAAPDLLSIDIEGLDLPILKTLDFDHHRPKVICAETLVTATFRHNPDTVAFLAGKGYEVRGMTFANTVFVDRQLLGA